MLWLCEDTVITHELTVRFEREGSKREGFKSSLLCKIDQGIAIFFVSVFVDCFKAEVPWAT